MADNVDTVIVDAASDDDGQAGPIQFEDIELLVVEMESRERHVWFDGSHYTANTTAETVSEGDRFYTAVPEQMVYEVVAIDESVAQPIKIEYLYPSGGVTTERISHDALTGLPVEDQPMGYLGPPTLLEEV